MLNHQELIENINNSKIAISYFFLPTEDSDEFVQITKIRDEEALKKKSKQFLYSKIGRNRLGITLGALINILDGKKVKEKNRWKNFKTIHDLRTDSFILDPKETIVALTNEHFKISNGHTAIILSRVSHFSRGLTIHPTYIQSGWEGILKIQITNLSNSSIKLKLGDEIGGVFFFSSSTDTKEGIEKDIDANHYKYNWSKLLDGFSINPFSESDSQNKDLDYYFKGLKQVLIKDWQLYLKRIGIIGVGISLFLFTYGLKERLDKYIQNEPCNGNFIIEKNQKVIEEELPLRWKIPTGILIVNNQELLESYNFERKNNKNYIQIIVDNDSINIGKKFEWILIPNK